MIKLTRRQSGEGEKCSDPTVGVSYFYFLPRIFGRPFVDRQVGGKLLGAIVAANMLRLAVIC